jgi:hypothetical protein
MTAEQLAVPLKTTDGRTVIVRSGSKWEPFLGPEHIELRLSGDPDFPKKFGKRVKAVGGSYTEARGGFTDRFVTLPAAALDLADEISATFGLRHLILRGGSASGLAAANTVWMRTKSTVPGFRASTAVAFLYTNLVQTAVEARSEVEIAASGFRAVTDGELALLRSYYRWEANVQAARAEIPKAEAALIDVARRRPAGHPSIANAVVALQEADAHLWQLQTSPDARPAIPAWFSSHELTAARQRAGVTLPE